MIRFASRPLRLAAAMAGAVLAASCAADGDYFKLAPDLHPITVRQTQSTLELAASIDKAVLSFDEIDGLTALAAEQRTAGVGPIVIALPIGGRNGEAAVEVGAKARDFLYAQGIAYKDIQGVAYDSEGRDDAPLVVIVDRYVAEGPKCHDRWENLTVTWRNDYANNFGCTTQANLAAMIANPADLLGPRDSDPADVNRRSTVIDAYRSGAPTITPRSGPEMAGN